jgi:hypothetical protein
MGVVALPLQELVRSAPTYFRCPDTGKTFASLAAYTAHAKARQQQQQQQQLRSSDSSSKRSSTIIAVPPVQIRTYDSYLTVASADAEAYVKVSHALSTHSIVALLLCMIMHAVQTAAALRTCTSSLIRVSHTMWCSPCASAALNDISDSALF